MLEHRRRVYTAQKMNVSELDALKQRLSDLREQERTYLRENDDAEGNVQRYEVELATVTRNLNQAIAQRDRLHDQLEKIERDIEKLESRIEQKEVEEAAARKRARDEQEAARPYVAPPPDPQDVADKQWMREKGIRNWTALAERTKMMEEVVADFERRSQRPNSRLTEKFGLAFNEAREELARLRRIKDRQRQRILGINKCIACRSQGVQPRQYFCGQKCQEAFVLSKLERFYVYFKMRLRRTLGG
jgi:DNA repair exonuclease SbcCD ATPase subunit